MYLKLDEKFFQKLLSQADKSPRMRSHYTLHKHENEAVQRLCVGLKKGTYVRPHHHQQLNKWELLIVLKGSITLVIFNNDGVVLKRFELNPSESLNGIEIEPNTWHTVFPVTDNAVFLEVKEGPYTPTVNFDFAPWAPKEGNVDVPIFQRWLETAQKGEKYTK
jgi:cupin fold WbuC family metalloprotein